MPSPSGSLSYAQDALGDLVVVERPAVGRKLKMGGQYGVVVSVKSESDIYLPVAGEVSVVNGDLDTAPEKNQPDCL